jgi:hypothetical protein
MSTQSLAVIRSFKVIIGPAAYQDIAAQIIIDPPPFFTVGARAFRILGFFGRSPKIHQV